MTRILIIDDNEDNLDVLARLLQRRGFDVATATSGKMGVSQATSDPVDVILMDMNMPEMDGWQATRLIREHGLTVPIIALTAHAMAGDRERAMEAGCTEYHTKPIDLEPMLALIERLLSEPTAESP